MASLEMQLSQAITEYLRDSGFDIGFYSYNDLVDKKVPLVRPAANVTINSAKAKQVTFTTYKWVVTVSVNLLFSSLKSYKTGEKERKDGIYELIEGVSQALVLQNFDLPLENRLYPLAYRNITSFDLAKAGYQLYVLDFWAAYNIKYTEPQDLTTGYLKEILCKYYLEPGAGIPVTGHDTKEDLIELPQ